MTRQMGTKDENSGWCSAHSYLEVKPPYYINKTYLCLPNGHHCIPQSKVAQPVRATVAKPEDLSLVSGTHMMGAGGGRKEERGKEGEKDRE